MLLLKYSVFQKVLLRNGKPIPSANHFVAKWYTRPCLEIDGRLVNLWDKKSPINPEDSRHTRLLFGMVAIQTERCRR